MTDTPLDRAHARMLAAPEDDTARLGFFERLADAGHRGGPALLSLRDLRQCVRRHGDRRGALAMRPAGRALRRPGQLARAARGADGPHL